MKRRLTQTVSALALVAALAACGVSLPTQSCTSGTVSRLYLGKDTPSGPVTEAQWQGFVADTVTSQFPDGFTVLSAKGQWRDDTGKVQQEDTRVIEVVHDNLPATQARVRAVAHAYKRIFSQQSVLVSQSPSFQCF